MCCSDFKKVITFALIFFAGFEVCANELTWEEGSTVATVEKKQITLQPGELPQEFELASAGARWVRLVLRAHEGKARLQIMDLANSVVETISISPDEPIVTKPISLARGRLKVLNNSHSVSLLAIIREKSPISVESNVNGKQLRDIQDEALFFQGVSRGIALIEFQKNNDIKRCNGFALSKRLIITNDHCIGDDDPFKSEFKPRAYFDFVGDGSSVEVPIEARIAGIQKDLDFAVLIIPKGHGLDSGRILKVVSDEASTLASPSALRLLQYYEPEGWAMRSSYDKDCRIWASPVDGRAKDTDAAHGCDCEKGSSGAPLLRAYDGAVVGLHHWGKNLVPKWDYNKSIRSLLFINELKRLKTANSELFKGSNIVDSSIK